MTRADAARLLTKLAAYDRRTIGEADATAWAEALGDIDLADALEAVPAHYRESTDFAMPAHILSHVKRIRAGRSRGTSAPLALETYGKYNPRPGQADRNRTGHEQCTQTIIEMRTA